MIDLIVKSKFSLSLLRVIYFCCFSTCPHIIVYNIKEDLYTQKEFSGILC